MVAEQVLTSVRYASATRQLLGTGEMALRHFIYADAIPPCRMRE